MVWEAETTEVDFGLVRSFWFYLLNENSIQMSLGQCAAKRMAPERGTSTPMLMRLLGVCSTHNLYVYIFINIKQ